MEQVFSPAAVAARQMQRPAEHLFVALRKKFLGADGDFLEPQHDSAIFNGALNLS